MTLNFLLVFLGGGLGSLSRYLVYLGFSSQSFFHALLPNVLGCFLLGLVTQTFVAEHGALNTVFVFGFLGGFTTFSGYIGFMGQTGLLGLNSSLSTAALYFALNNILGFGFYILGVKFFS